MILGLVSVKISDTPFLEHPLLYQLLPFYGKKSEPPSFLGKL